MVSLNKLQPVLSHICDNSLVSVKTAKGECTTLEKTLAFRVGIIAVAYCVVELGWLKKERRRKQVFDLHWFAALEVLVSPSTL